ncbi:MAG: PrgI family protein [Clostridiales bacterium]|jgi:hypothetical protein|nr:PrgI family protein [Clostridiales bacterium]
MEVKVSRNIQEFSENIYFGLKFREFIFSLLAVLVAVGIYFMLKPYFSIGTLSWVCLFGAAPFAAMGFVKYNGMTAEQFAWAWIKSEFLIPEKLVFLPTNLYCEAIKDIKEEN